MRLPLSASATLRVLRYFAFVYISLSLVNISLFELQISGRRQNGTFYSAEYGTLLNTDMRSDCVKNAENELVPFLLDGRQRNNIETVKTEESSTTLEATKVSDYLTMYGDHKAEESFRMLPSWLQEYIKWNRNLRPQLNTDHEESNKKDSENSEKYFVMTCLPKDLHCGGLSDRLRILPFYLLAAKMTSRLFCIYWRRPFPLEEYLQPTAHGILWSCPSELSNWIDESKSSARQKRRKTKNMIDFHPWHRCHDTPLIKCTEEGITKTKLSRAKFVIIDMDSHSYHRVNEMNLIFQRHSHANYSRSHSKKVPNLQHWSYAEHTNHIFKVFFQPVKRLAETINKTMTTLGLVEKEYVSVHVRSRYPVQDVALVHERIDAIDKEGQLNFDCEDNRCICNQNHEYHMNLTIEDYSTTKYLIDVVTNAIQCGGTLLQSDEKSDKLYFVSDHHNITRFATSNQFLTPLLASKRPLNNFHEEQHYVQPVGSERNSMPFHFETKHYKSLQPTDFDSVFVDLLIMGGSSCVTYGIGSFGSFGAALAGTCRAIHRKFDGGIIHCPNNRSDVDFVIFNEYEMLFKGKN